jgi:predicted ester cyclase
VLLAVAAPALVMHFAELPDPLHGRETSQQGFELIMRAFADVHAEIDDLVAAGGRVAVRMSFREIHYVSHEFYRVEGGVIAEEWICSDMASLFRQPG